MEFCSGGDLSIYIRKRGKLASLEYPLSDPTGRMEDRMVFWPHPKEGGLDDFVVRNFLGQLGECEWSRLIASLTRVSPFLA
jgi:serine/threonine-protein kinase ULK/ATG1